MYYEFIDLDSAPLIVKELAENIHMIINSQIAQWKTEQIDVMDCKKIVDSFMDTDKLMASVLTMESEDKDVLLLFQMAVYRFCTVYVPVILEKIADRLKKEEVKKEEDNPLRQLSLTKLAFANPTDEKELVMVKMLNSGLSEENFREWEKEFWRKGKFINRNCELSSAGFSVFGNSSIETMCNYRKRLRKQKTVEKDSERNYDTRTVREVMDLAFQDKGIIEKVEELQQYYKPLKTKAKKLNTMLKNNEMKVELQKIKNITDIVDRGIQGELTAADIMDLEENVQLWNASLKSLINFFACSK